MTSKELIAATGWQPHSMRGFLSGTIGKKMGLLVRSTKGEGGERTYSIQARAKPASPLLGAAGFNPGGFLRSCCRFCLIRAVKRAIN